MVARKLWHSLVCRHITPSLPSCSHGILPVHISVSSLFLFRTQSYWIRALPNDFILIICKDSISQHSHIHRYWRLGLQYLLEGYNSAHDRWGDGREGVGQKVMPEGTSPTFHHPYNGFPSEFLRLLVMSET